MFDCSYSNVFSEASMPGDMPVLLPKALDFDYAFAYPIPVAWFLDLNKAAFWDAHVKMQVIYLSNRAIN